ncbi:MAG: NADPH-dependent 7-cyano-7-deazaguanine reductase QueF [Gammaproteobacteria bacterium]|nr:NADPH-dependent 7-cyano-7-deazaguanine reductase QueF [Pseudomonadales bacterium]
MDGNPLGQATEYPSHYDPGLLYGIPRWASRSLLDIDKKLELHGFDLWRAYELSWLNEAGKPEAAMGEFYFDARSENLVESKSLKLYLNSLNNEVFARTENFAERIASDLKEVTSSEVKVVIRQLAESSAAQIRVPPGKCIDNLAIRVTELQPDAELLRTTGAVTEQCALYSNLFRSNCPVTGQPDWATVMVQYSGPRIEESSLLAYLCSFRQHAGYHEECAERIYRDLMFKCAPESLTVGMNFNRRGGLDINPFRSNRPISPERRNYRFVRQ